MQEDITQVIEDKVKFSESLIWQYQRNYFINKGNAAWTNDNLPSYVTNNAIIANSYAQTTLRFIQDCLNNNKINPDFPMYLFELGTGLGKFGYLFLQKIVRLLKHFHLDYLKCCYVMTDFSLNNLKYLQNHPNLQKFIQEGILDFAIFDLACEQGIVLKQTNTGIKDTLKNPAIVFANYVFDTLSEDVMRIKDGKIYEGLTTLKSKTNQPQNLSSLENIQIDFAFSEISTPYYYNKAIDSILDDYKNKLIDSVFLVPRGAITAINTIKKLTNSNFLMVVTDKGYTSIEAMEGLEKPHFAFHGGCFSMMVNFDFLIRYIKNIGGNSLPTQEHDGIKTLLFCFGQKFANLPETLEADYQFNTHFSAQEFIELGAALTKDIANLDLYSILSIMKLSYWDPDTFVILAQRLSEVLSQANPGYLKTLRIGLKTIADNHYLVDNNRKVLFSLGSIYYLINDLDEAIISYQKFIKHFGDNFEVLFNLGLCFLDNNNLSFALKYFKDAEKLNPQNDLIKSYINKTERSL